MSRDFGSFPNATVDTVNSTGKLLTDIPGDDPPGQNIALTVFLQWIESQLPADTGVDIAALPPALAEVIERGDTNFILDVRGTQERLQGDLLAQWVADRVAEDTRQGEDGTDGWTAQLAVVEDGEKRHLKVSALVGGTGDKPAGIEGMYLGPNGLVAAKADATDIRGPAGSGGSGGATTFATETEAEAGTEAAKAISPLTLAEVLEHVRAVIADVTNGVVGKLVDAAVLKGLLDAIPKTANIEDVALKSILDADLSDDVKQAFRERIGAESEDGEYGPYATSSQRYGSVPGGLGLGPTIPDGATHLEFTITAESEQLINYTTRELLVEQFLALPSRNRGDNAISNSSGVIETAFDERDTQTPGADAQRGYIAHNGRTILYASDQSIGAAIRVRFKASRVETYALVGTTTRMPHSRLPEDVVVLEQGHINPNLIQFPPSSAPPAGEGYYPDADRQKLVGIERGAEVNVKSDWNATTGPEEILNKPDVPPAASALPVALSTSVNRLQVQETAGRRDLGLNFAARPGGDFDYGDIYGSIADRQGATAGHITSNIGGIRYSGTAFQLDCYVLDVSEGGGVWDRVWINGYEVAVAHEFGLTTVPWSTSTTRWRHFRTAVIPQANRPDFGDPVAVNFRDTRADAGQQYFVGNPYVREATTEPLDQRFVVITQDDYTALAPKVVDTLYLVTP